MRLPSFLADPEPARGLLAFTGARLFDGSGAAVRDGVTVVVEDGRVRRVGTTGDGVPEGATRRRSRGACADAGPDRRACPHHDAPALARVPHRGQGSRAARATTSRGTWRRRAFAERCGWGITTVRDVGAYGDILFGVRQAMRYGAFAGPRLLVCGRIVSATAPGGRFFPGMYREADGADDVRRAVREQIRAGADFVKIMSTGARTVELEDPDPAQVTRDELATLVDEAHRLGYRVAAHCEGLARHRARRGGGCGHDRARHPAAPPPRPAGAAGRSGRGARADALVPPRPGRGRVLGGAARRAGRAERGGGPRDARRGETGSGVRLAMGFDSPEIDRAASELLRLVEHGLPVHEALAAATSGGAYALGIDSEVGLVAEGKLADLLVVDGDPVAEPAVLLDRSRIWLVLRNGEPVAGASLEAVV